MHGEVAQNTKGSGVCVYQWSGQNRARYFRGSRPLRWAANRQLSICCCVVLLIFPVCDRCVTWDSTHQAAARSSTNASSFVPVRDFQLTLQVMHQALQQ